MRAAREREFVEFVQACSARLLRTAELLVGDRHQAEDLVQTALLNLYRVWGRERRADPLAYVRRVMVNTRTDWWRRRSTHERPIADVPEIAVDDGSEAHSRADVLHRALATLTPTERAVIVFRYYDDLTEVQTAHALGVAVGTVKSNVARALGKLRRARELDELMEPQ
jgi:RNA polymerase sigma-70 factor (sigma-E family)